MIIKNFSNYDITEKAVITNIKTGKIIKGSIKKGYRVATLTGDDGKPHESGVHRILMITFRYVDGCEELVVNHLDGNKLNLDLDNLEWCSSKENTHHALTTGLKHGNAISDENVISIRKEYIPGANGNYKELLEKYSLKKSMLYAIIKDEFRKDLPLTSELNSLVRKKETKCSGIDNGRVKLNYEIATSIREMYFKKNMTLTKIGEIFGVSAVSVSKVVRNITFVSN